MEYRNLGNSGLEVSVVGLGTNNFGGRTDEAGTKAVIDACFDEGINFIDTADVYGNRGLSEEYIGRALKGRRHQVLIGTKFANAMGEGPLTRGGSRAYIMKAVEDSLRRLETDYIDLYQMHTPDAKTPIEETLRTLDDLVTSGKVRYIGNSNYAGWQVADAAHVAKANGYAPFISAQNAYSLLDRRLETELVPAMTKFGVSLIPYSPLASGLLTGKYHRGEAAPEGTRLASGPMAQRLLTDRNYDVVEKLEEFAHGRGHSVLELAFSWLASLPYVATVIAGATRPEQVAANAAAASWRLTAEEMAEVDQITKR
ncbi:MAG: aldo/keto reductase [Dehalococcoidia bacterium]|nr:aldo/keto reductase [Dehalococcoidia bacterium]